MKPSQHTRQHSDEALQSFTESVRERVASRETLLAEAKAQTRKRRTARQSTLGLLLGAAVLGALWQFDPAWYTEDVQAAIGQRQHLQLADGSVVELDSGSHLRIERRLRSRQVQLVEGQAQFKVVHADQPFIVRTQGVRILDVGTVFDVRSDPRAVTVAVIEGAVEVSNDSRNTLRLVAGQQLQADALQISAARPVDLAALTAWQRGKLRFNGASLADVVIDLQRYRQAPILVADARTGGLRLSGEFDSDAVETLLQLLPTILPVSVNWNADGSVVLSGRH